MRLVEDTAKLRSCYIGIGFYKSRDGETVSSSLAQVFDALSYYSDNQKEIEQLIVQNRVSSQYDSPEHNRLGRSGTELAATVWDHEDFSDWEK